MASIIASKSADVQYAIVGKSQNILQQTSPDYNVGFTGTDAISQFTTYFTYMQTQGYAETRTATSFKDDGDLQAALNSALHKIAKTGYVALTGAGMPLGEDSGKAFDDAFTALAAAYVAATNE